MRNRIVLIGMVQNSAINKLRGSCVAAGSLPVIARIEGKVFFEQPDMAITTLGEDGDGEAILEVFETEGRTEIDDYAASLTRANFIAVSGGLENVFAIVMDEDTYEDFKGDGTMRHWLEETHSEVQLRVAMNGDNGEQYLITI